MSSQTVPWSPRLRLPGNEEAERYRSDPHSEDVVRPHAELHARRELDRHVKRELPDVEQVREGVIAARIAAHAGDIAKGVPGAAEADRRISALRRDRNWKGQMEMALDSRHADEIRAHAKSAESTVCSMCGKFCVFRIADGEDAPAPEHS